MKNKIKLQERGKWEMTFKRNLNKACALICSHMSLRMESHVKLESDFDSDAKDNPVKPLSQMCTLMHNLSRSRHPFASLTEAIRRLVNTKMEDTESLISCNEKVKQAKDTLKSHSGTKTLDEFITHRRVQKSSDRWQFSITKGNERWHLWPMGLTFDGGQRRPQKVW